MVSGIPARAGKITNLFLQCRQDEKAEESLFRSVVTGGRSFPAERAALLITALLAGMLRRQSLVPGTFPAWGNVVAQVAARQLLVEVL